VEKKGKWRRGREEGGKGKERKGKGVENQLTHPMSQIPSYASA